MSTKPTPSASGLTTAVHIGRLDKWLEAAAAKGWTVVDIKHHPEIRSGSEPKLICAAPTSASH
jgi:hypothetical protein